MAVQPVTAIRRMDPSSANRAAMQAASASRLHTRRGTMTLPRAEGGNRPAFLPFTPDMCPLDVDRGGPTGPRP
jgi:hypothetical protein